MKIVAWEEAKLNREIKRWNLSEAILYCISEIIRKEFYYGVYCKLQYHPPFRAARKRLKEFFVQKDGISYFDFCGAKLPDVTRDKEKFHMLDDVFEDTFLVPCYHNENYDKDFVEYIDRVVGEGPYGYVDGKFDVRVKKGDVVIDAGAWIGDFSAYAATKGATSYAFEPTKETYDWLVKTAELNEKGRIVPIHKGLGDKEETLSISTSKKNSAGNSFIRKGNASEQVEITTIDQFVKERNLPRVDFIKADIEGFERNMLTGARETLKKFAPKLALCTYHLPDDPQVMAMIIKEANPDYKIVFLRHKLFAAVVK